MTKLRASGWTVPAEVAEDHVVRVYDTRLDRGWLRQVLPEVGVEAVRAVLVGGDMLLPSQVDDSVALQPGRLERWGPAGSDPYHVVVLPRPHLDVWMRRVHQQLAMEAGGSVITVAVVVPRDRCPQVWDA